MDDKFQPIHAAPRINILAPTPSAMPPYWAPPHINHESLRDKDFTKTKIDEIEDRLHDAFDIKFVFNKWTLGAEFLTQTLNIPAEDLEDPKI